jgi:hypothetical protein
LNILFHDSEKRFINNNNINPFVFLDLITFHLYLSDTRHSASFGINHYNYAAPDNNYNYTGTALSPGAPITTRDVSLAPAVLADDTA